MDIENTKRALEDCMSYNYNIESLRKELHTVTNHVFKDKISAEIEALTEKTMNIRCKIDELKGTNVRLVMRMRYMNLMSFKDIAKNLKITYQWVNKLHNDGIEQLSKML